MKKITAVLLMALSFNVQATDLYARAQQKQANIMQVPDFQGQLDRSMQQGLRMGGALQNAQSLQQQRAFNKQMQPIQLERSKLQNQSLRMQLQQQKLAHQQQLQLQKLQLQKLQLQLQLQQLKKQKQTTQPAYNDAPVIPQ